ncbi:hypothetical protein [Methyloceanibacter sp.]|uniref:hypothetical protein n=1 Tax=Methyloceanibacter sp. TaxID=1965321 RepID=UPI002D4D34DC|nr:hypothetical protein [Methyloceanibacter sp.]HZP09319.1 hypothetical protein [Methyloceanibacter sp.]
MRDIRNDLQDRANLLEEQINSAEAQFESLVEQLRAEHEGRLADLRAEFDAVSRLLEVEERRLANIPVTPAPTQAPKVQPQPRAQTHAPLPHQQAPVHVQPAAQPHTPPRAQAVAQPHIPQHVQTHAQPYMPARPQHQVPHIQQDPHIQQAQAEALVQQPQPQQPLADFLVRKLNEQGAMSRDDLRLLAVQEGYFEDGEIAERSVHAALISVNKAGLIRQLPNGNFAPASMMDAIRLRRAI